VFFAYSAVFETANIRIIVYANGIAASYAVASDTADPKGGGLSNKTNALRALVFALCLAFVTANKIIIAFANGIAISYAIASDTADPKGGGFQTKPTHFVRIFLHSPCF